MSTLDKDVQEAIAKNLSQEVAGVLKQRLEELEGTEQKYGDLVRSYDDLTERASELKETLNSTQKELDHVMMREKELQKKEKTMEENLVNLRIREAELSLKEEYTEKRYKDAKDFFSIPFKNRSFRESVVTHNSEIIDQYYDYDGNLHPSRNNSTTQDSTKIVEEE